MNEARELVTETYKHFERITSSAVSPDTTATIALGLTQATIQAMALQPEPGERAGIKKSPGIPHPRVTKEQRSDFRSGAGWG